MSKNKNRIKRTHQQADQYRNYIQSNTDSPETTTGVMGVTSLIGSGESVAYPSSYKDKEERIAKKSFRLKIQDYWELHSAEVVISAILIPTIIWLASAVIDLQIDRAIFRERVDNIKESVAEISSDSANKDVLNIQIASIESDLSNILNANIPDIEKRISTIENEVKTIKDSN